MPRISANASNSSAPLRIRLLNGGAFIVDLFAIRAADVVATPHMDRLLGAIVKAKSQVCQFALWEGLPCVPPQMRSSSRARHLLRRLTHLTPPYLAHFCLRPRLGWGLASWPWNSLSRRARPLRKGSRTLLLRRLGQYSTQLVERCRVTAAFFDQECPSASQTGVAVAMGFEPAFGPAEILDEIVVFHDRPPLRASAHGRRYAGLPFIRHPSEPSRR
jgi:hypothetical protein